MPTYALQEVLAGPLAEIYGGPLPMVPLPGDDELPLKFAQHLLQILQDKEIYRRDNVVVYPYEQRRRLEIVDAEDFLTWVEHHCVCYKTRYDDSGDPFPVLRPMPTGMSKTVLRCRDFWQGLREIERCHPVPMPMINEAGELVMLAAGYDAESKTLTFG